MCVPVAPNYVCTAICVTSTNAAGSFVSLIHSIHKHSSAHQAIPPWRESIDNARGARIGCRLLGAHSLFGSLESPLARLRPPRQTDQDAAARRRDGGLRIFDSNVQKSQHIFFVRKDRFQQKLLGFVPGTSVGTDASHKALKDLDAGAPASRKKQQRHGQRSFWVGSWTTRYPECRTSLSKTCDPSLPSQRTASIWR